MNNIINHNDIENCLHELLLDQENKTLTIKAFGLHHINLNQYPNYKQLLKQYKSIISHIQKNNQSIDKLTYFQLFPDKLPQKLHQKKNKPLLNELSLNEISPEEFYFLSFYSPNHPINSSIINHLLLLHHHMLTSFYSKFFTKINLFRLNLIYSPLLNLQYHFSYLLAGNTLSLFTFNTTKFNLYRKLFTQALINYNPENFLNLILQAINDYITQHPIKTALVVTTFQLFQLNYYSLLPLNINLAKYFPHNLNKILLTLNKYPILKFLFPFSILSFYKNLNYIATSSTPKEPIPIKSINSITPNLTLNYPTFQSLSLSFLQKILNHHYEIYENNLYELQNLLPNLNKNSIKKILSSEKKINQLISKLENILTNIIKNSQPLITFHLITYLNNLTNLTNLDNHKLLPIKLLLAFIFQNEKHLKHIHIPHPPLICSHSYEKLKLLYNTLIISST